MNGLHNEEFKLGDFLRQPGRLELAERTLSELIDFNLSLYAILVANNLASVSDLARMVKVVKDVRKRLGKQFSFNEGMKVIQATFKIEGEAKGG
jgi:hypothetical protein